MKAFVIMYNRLTWPKALCEYLSDTGCEVILIDNDSTYQPLLEWYERCPYKVHRMTQNYGHFVLWKSNLINDYKDRYYIVTDHDLDLKNVPIDYINFLMKGLKQKDICKSGLSLEIEDLPNNPYAKEAYEWEKKFWNTAQDINGFYFSDIDTTFALYDRERNINPLPPEGFDFFHAVRAPRPYTALHLPWYIDKEFLEKNEEERYYQDHTHTYWSQKLKEWNV